MSLKPILFEKQMKNVRFCLHHRPACRGRVAPHGAPPGDPQGLPGDPQGYPGAQGVPGGSQGIPLLGPHAGVMDSFRKKLDFLENLAKKINLFFFAKN